MAQKFAKRLFLLVCVAALLCIAYFLLKDLDRHLTSRLSPLALVTSLGTTLREASSRRMSTILADPDSALTTTDGTLTTPSVALQDDDQLELTLPITGTPWSSTTREVKVAAQISSSAAEEEGTSRSVSTTSSRQWRASSYHQFSASLKTQVSSDPPKKLLCIYFTGQLGNELFQYASTLALALTLNRTPVFLGITVLHGVLKHFVSSTNVPELEARCKTARLAEEESCCKYSEKFTHLDPDRDYRLHLYLQSYRYFHNHEAQVREAVTFADNVVKKSSQVVQQLRQTHSSSVLVGVHVRRGETALHITQKMGYPLVTPQYIHAALDFFQQLYPRCVFVVASDSVDWCRDHLPGGFHVHYLTGNEAAVDMAILAALDHAVITFGTFSWWVGYLSQGKTVYMKDFIVPNSTVGKGFNPDGKDYIYPGWIPL